MARAEDDRTDLCLVIPPFASVSFPQLGPAVLKAACEQSGAFA